MNYLIIFFIQLVILFLTSRKINRGVYRIIYKVLGRESLSYIIYTIFFFPGTFIHEISHLIVALFLLVPVGKINLFPKRTDNNVVLGSVEVVKSDFIRMFFVGIAPLLIGVLVIYFSTFFFLLDNSKLVWYEIILLVYLIFTVSNSMYLSKSDLKTGLEFIVFVITVFALLFFFGIDIKITLERESFLVFQNLNYVMLVPLALNIIFLGFAKIMKVNT